ncbi:iron-containing alcohol dehydrogenase [uncultured Martelella sp.]|uniref:iron-containing alcohol dehydrogenase n=1 Tax=uncultured Martelella sp. TaxID=392331 RepID=UPI0029C63C87|nr:iron-containing alcohol dehydrogenase [uncultured Martelella sp.]
MLSNLNFGLTRAPACIIFGPGQRDAAALHAARLGRRALLVTDARLSANPDFAALRDALAGAGLETATFDGVEAELPVACIEAGARAGRDHEADMVLAIGGGSCLDAAKVIALLLSHGGRPQDYYGENKVPGPVLPLIALPTTAGTGSEVTPVAVLADPERAMKIGIASPYLIPTISICDPELTLSCPPGLTAVSGADALTHAIEAFTTLRRDANPDLSTDHVFTGKNAMSDLFALEAIRLIAGSLEQAVRAGNDLEARAAMSRGALLAGLAFGVAGTAAAHAIQYPVGALTHTPHGAGVATLMPYVMAWNHAYCEAELAQIGSAMGLDATGDTHADALAAIREVARLFKAIAIPETLEELGLADSLLDQVARDSLGAERLVKNNPRPLDLDGMSRIVAAAQTGNLDNLLAQNEISNQKVAMP